MGMERVGVRECWGLREGGCGERMAYLVAEKVVT